MSCDDIKTVSEFYGNWNSEEIMCEHPLLFTQLRRLDHSISNAKISKEMRQNCASADMAPNFISALKTYIALPSSACKAERSFSTLCRLKTNLRSMQMQQHLNDLAILNAHCDHAEALDLAEAIHEFVSRMQTCHNKFGLSS